MDNKSSSIHNKFKRFAHLHVHTEYSLRDGLCKVGESTGNEPCQLLTRVMELGQDSIAITDTGNLQGAMNIYRKAMKTGIKVIFGSELLLFCDNARENRMHRLIVLAENEQGYHNLCRLLSHGFGGMYCGVRCIDKLLLYEYASGLIALSGGMKSEIAYNIAHAESDIHLARRTAKEYTRIFGENNFFIELIRCGLPAHNKINTALFELSKETGIPVVATANAHYLHPEEAELHGLLRQLNGDVSVETEPTGDLHFCSTETMFERFSDIPLTLENSINIAARCNVHFHNRKPAVPALKLSVDSNESNPAMRNPVELPAELTSNKDKYMAYLRHLCETALPRLYPENQVAAKTQLDLELRVIGARDLVDYFLLHADITTYARQQGIRAFPGQSAWLSSIVNYLLGITAIDPLRHNSSLDSLINDDTGNIPCVEVGYDATRVGEIVSWLQQRYGCNNVAYVGKGLRYHSWAAIDDIAEALDYDRHRARQIATMVAPYSIDAACDNIPFLKDIRDNGKPWEINLLKFARQLEGLPYSFDTRFMRIAINESSLIMNVPAPRHVCDCHRNILRCTLYDQVTLEYLGILTIAIPGVRA